MRSRTCSATRSRGARTYRCERSSSCARADQEHVAHLEPAGRRAPCRFQDHGARQVAAAGRDRPVQRPRAKPPRMPVEDRREDARPVHLRQRQPLDVPARRDERADFTVREQRVIGNRRKRASAERNVAVRAVAGRHLQPHAATVLQLRWTELLEPPDRPASDALGDRDVIERTRRGYTTLPADLATCACRRHVRPPRPARLLATVAAPSSTRNPTDRSAGNPGIPLVMATGSTDIAVEGDGALLKPEPHVLVLFGATGDLARRKLIPGLFHLEQVGLMPEDYRIIGTSLDELDDDAFREHARDALGEFCRMPIDDDDWRAFSERLGYVPSGGRAGRRRRAGRAGDRARGAPAALPVGAAVRRRADRADTRGRRAGRARPRGHGEAVRYRP